MVATAVPALLPATAAAKPTHWFRAAAMADDGGPVGPHGGRRPAEGRLGEAPHRSAHRHLGEQGGQSDGGHHGIALQSGEHIAQDGRIGAHPGRRGDHHAPGRRRVRRFGVVEVEFSQELAGGQSRISSGGGRPTERTAWDRRGCPSSCGTGPAQLKRRVGVVARAGPATALGGTTVSLNPSEPRAPRAALSRVVSDTQAPGVVQAACRPAMASSTWAPRRTCCSSSVVPSASCADDRTGVHGHERLTQGLPIRIGGQRHQRRQRRAGLFAQVAVEGHQPGRTGRQRQRRRWPELRRWRRSGR